MSILSNVDIEAPMTPKHRSRILTMSLLVVTAMAALWPAVAAAPAAPSTDPYALDRVMPVDEAVRTGRLDNGLTYYVRANHKPEARAELRLLVNVGSIVEDDSQRGLAHFVEHMLSLIHI